TRARRRVHRDDRARQAEQPPAEVPALRGGEGTARFRSRRTSMTAKHTERAFEEAIEHHLITKGGWHKVAPTAFDRERALIASEVFAYIEATQGALLRALREQHGAGLEAGLLDTLDKSRATRGSLDLLR